MTVKTTEYPFEEKRKEGEGEVWDRCYGRGFGVAGTLSVI